MKKEYLTLLICFVLLSCQKEMHVIKERFSSITNTGLELEFVNFLNEEANGSITMYASNGIGHPASSDLVITAGFESETIVELDFNTITISKTDNYFHYFDLAQDPDIYGDMLSFQISSDFPAVSVYLPERIFGSYNYTSLKPGNTITWNADTLNDKGVVVVLEYNPYFQFLQEDPAEHDHITNYALTDDNGSYQLPASIFDGLPVGAMVSVFLYRGNFQTRAKA